MSPRRLTLALALAAAAGAVFLWPRSTPVVAVEPGQDVGELAEGHPGAVLELEAGRHEAFVLETPVTVRARPGAVVQGDVEIRADGAVLESVDVVGGTNGILVRGVDGVVLDGVRVRGAELHGIEVIDASVRIEGCTVRDLQSEYAQGIEIRNSTGRLRSVIEGCTVAGGMESIVSHSARLEVIDNHVSGSTMRGITIGEMSDGLVRGNRIERLHGVGILCRDMSRCEISANVVQAVRAMPGGWNSVAGNGIVAHYRSAMRLRDNVVLDVDGTEVKTMVSSRLVSHFPLVHWPRGWVGAWPGIPVTAIALALLLLGHRLARAGLHRRAEPTASRDVPSGVRAVLVAAVVVAVAVQVFHMVEHLVQVWQVYVAETENRSGILGARADTEWVHFLFNASVLAFLVLLWRAGRVTGALDRRAGSWLFATLAIQTFHMAEHAAKLWQHLGDGVRTAPGIIGGQLGLVWFHYGINLTVFVGTVVAAVMLVRCLLWPASAGGSYRPPAGDAGGEVEAVDDVEDAPVGALERAGV